MNIALPDELYKRLEQLAFDMDISRSELARLILAQYFVGKLELKIEDQQAAERLIKMTGRWPRGEVKKKRRRTTNRK